MSENEEVTVLIDLDRIPEYIGHIRERTTHKGTYSQRIYMPEDYDALYNWIMNKLVGLKECKVNIQGNLPNWMMMTLAIDLVEDGRVTTIYHSKFGDCPTMIWEGE